VRSHSSARGGAIDVTELWGLLESKPEDAGVWPALLVLLSLSYSGAAFGLLDAHFLTFLSGWQYYSTSGFIIPILLLIRVM
jgi:hypothetical protein